MENRWFSDAMTGVGLAFLATVGIGLVAAADGAWPLLGFVLIALTAPLALVFLVAGGVRLGTKP